MANLDPERIIEQDGPFPHVENYAPIEVAIALSLYAYNVSPSDRARKIHKHFKGDCMEIDELVSLLERRSAYAGTELPFLSAEFYVQCALKMYGEQARGRVFVNRQY